MRNKSVGLIDYLLACTIGLPVWIACQTYYCWRLILCLSVYATHDYGPRGVECVRCKTNKKRPT